MAPSSDVESFRKVLSNSKNIVILAGAGLSAGSGIPTFRGAGGFWRKYNAMSLATPEAFGENPSRVWQFYHERRVKALSVSPNAAHYALAALARPAVIARIAPSLEAQYSPPLFITQNVDGLSKRVLQTFPPDAKAAGEKNLLQMHGSIFVTRCTSCGHEELNLAAPLCTALGQHQEVDDTEIPISDLPKCGGETWNGSNQPGNCGGLLRPAVVWFGEMPEFMDEIEKRLEGCDLILVVGTSSTVSPASEFAGDVRRRGGKVAIFNLERSTGDKKADFLFLGPCAETLPNALGVTAEDFVTH
ncbi:hypothetical protein FRB94_008246 [Tulasnella sp. JGI-2019a]|nr:hypothetical protein FRB93_006047 [Tulasnella sp. JGI-2019a]KAG8996487.1 hypothetical protein FRB94_008246 [Tulasnella sp. JGI-2019a]